MQESSAPSQTAPAAPPANPTAESHHPNAMQLVWQWLCYSLWALSLIGLSVLLSATLTYYLVDKNGDYEFIIYTLATVVCLLPLAWVADKLYAKQEPDQKHGFAAVILVLHAVFVSLATIGGLITAVVTILSVFVNPSNESAKKVVIISSLTVTVLGALLFARILNPIKLRKLNNYFPFIIVGITLVALILAAIGPFRIQIASRNDKLIEDNLPTVNDAVQKYASDNRRLPTTLSDIDLSTPNQTDAKSLVDRNLVDYRIIQQLDTTQPQSGATANTKYPPSAILQGNGRYELCVTYTHAKNGDVQTTPADYPTTYISTYSHKAGRQCYEQQTTAYVYPLKGSAATDL